MRRVVGWAVVVVLACGLVASAVVGALLLSEEGHHDPPDGPEVSRVVGSTADGWQVVTYLGLRVEVPPAWGRLDSSGCDFRAERWGPAGLDPCAHESGLRFFGSATFDPATGPGVHKTPPSAALPAGGWAGYVTRGDTVVDAADADREVVRRILRSVKEPG